MLEALIALLFGLLIGSFLNVCIHRLPNDYSVMRPARSYCPACRQTIAWFDNIPLLSFVLLGGRCRQCRGRIPWRYPAVEALTGALFFLVVYRYGVTPLALKQIVFTALLSGLIFLDLEERVLPDEFTMGGAAAGIALTALVPLDRSFLALFVPETWNRHMVGALEATVGAVTAGLMMWSMGKLYQLVRRQEGLGSGDPRMIAMIGAFLGLHGALGVVVLASILGSVVGLGYIWITRRDAHTYELPFGTFLGIAGLIAAFIVPPPVG